VSVDPLTLSSSLTLDALFPEISDLRFLGSPITAPRTIRQSSPEFLPR